MKSADRICWTDLAIITLTWVISLVLLGFVARLSWSLLTIGWSIL